MFGKAEWFKTKAVGWGLQPRVWQGWAYTLGWMGAMALPFVMLISRRQVPEACIWLISTAGLLIWDVANLRQSVRDVVEPDVLYIGDDGECCNMQRVANRGRFQAR